DVERVGPAEALDVEGVELESTRGVGAGDVRRGRARPADIDRAGRGGDVERVGGSAAVDGHAVSEPVARQIDVDLPQGGVGNVLDRQGVVSAELLEVDPLRVPDVHDDGAEVASEGDAVVALTGPEDLGGVAAVEQHRVGAGAAVHEVRAVARVPDDRVVARATELVVGALVAVD